MSASRLHLAMTDSLAWVTLDVPPANLLTRQVLQELESLFQRLKTDPTVKAIVLTGSGRFFCAGADIRELHSLNTVSEAMEFSKWGQSVLTGIERMDVPVIAAINGICLGGGLELALACHCRIAIQGSSYGLPETKLGLIPGFGGTQRLTRIVGTGKAIELIVTGETFSAEQALHWGIVSQIVEETSAVSHVQALARKMADNSVPAVRAALQAIRISRAASLEEGLDAEARLFSELILTEEAQERTTAFLEKRPPALPKRGDK